MSNTSNGPAVKGSKFQMQRISSPKYSSMFDKFIKSELSWFSPREDDNYKEYRSNNKNLLDYLGIDATIKRTYLSDFWPNPQLQWDGIAMGADKTLFLIEAKSHIKEIVPGKDGNPDNNKLKYNSIMECAKELFGIHDDNYNREIWCKKYYQIANRITFAHKFKQICIAEKVKYKDVKLLFLNFVNDTTHDKKKMVSDCKTWEEHYNKIILEELRVTKEQLEKQNVFIVNYDLTVLNAI